MNNLERGQMRKVGIISLYHNSYNYGGVLQAYALNHVIDRLGYKAVQIDYKPIRDNHIDSAANRYLKQHSIWQLIVKGINRSYKKLFIRIAGKEQESGIQKRKAIFDEFKKTYIASSPLYDTMTIKKAADEYDTFICGSDQIWKPTVVDDGYMLAFTKKSQFASSYAASLSVDSLSESDNERYKNWLGHLTNISVREEQAVKLLSSLTEKSVIHVCDPTLLIDGKEWSEICGSKMENAIEGNYLFCYFLGDDKVFRKQARLFAKRCGYKIVNFPSLQQKPIPTDEKFGDYKIYSASPFEFIRMINSASFVMTDSFHATAFALNLNKPFYVFERSAITSMNSRITSLLSLTGCEKRFVSDIGKTIDLHKEDSIDWNSVNSSISSFRNSSLNYLRTCIPD